MSAILNNCQSLVSLPDISKWNIKKVDDNRKMFDNCFLLFYLQDISNWNIKN